MPGTGGGCCKMYNLIKKVQEGSPFMLVFAGAIAVIILVAAVLVWFIHDHTSHLVFADVCAAVVEKYPENYIRMDVVRGYDEYWDQQIGTVIVVENRNQDIEPGDRLVLTAQTFYGKWNIDWTIYDECPEATVR